MSITDIATGTTAHQRTFWCSDYARFARAIRRTRHVMGDEHTAKSAEHQARCDELADAVAALFQADAPGAFSGEKFRAGTLLAGALPGYQDGEDDAAELRNSYLDDEDEADEDEKDSAEDDEPVEYYEAPLM